MSRTTGRSICRSQRRNREASCPVALRPIFPVDSSFLMVSSRDRIAPDFTIRHPVWPIVALQRRVRFSARFAGFCRIRCHQRLARRAERASFSVFVSNLDFRVPRLRQIGGAGADRGPCGGRKEVTREAQNRGRGYRGAAGASTFWSRCGPGLLDVHLCPGPGSRSSPRERGIPFLDGVSLRVQGNPNRRPQRHPPRALVSPRSNGRGSPRPRPVPKLGPFEIDHKSAA